MPQHSAHRWIIQKHLTKKQQKQLIKRSVLVVAIAEPLMTIPQIYEIWGHQQAEGVSLATWSLYAGSAVVWLLYGFQLKDRPLIISSILWIITEFIVVLGIILFN